MKNKYLYNILIFLFASLVNVNNAATAATETFFSPISDNDTVISETSGTFNSFVTYTPNSWEPSEVTNATLRIFLSDDFSDTFGPVIDAPREWVRLTSVSDGSIVRNGLTIDEEVDVRPFAPVHTGGNLAATVGIEDPGIDVGGTAPSTAPFFDYDVTSLIKDSDSGRLDFSLIALSIYPDIIPGTPAHDAIQADALSFLGITLAANQTFPVFEDFIFNQAELTVEFDQTAVPAPPAIFLIGIGGLLGLLFNRNRKV